MEQEAGALIKQGKFQEAEEIYRGLIAARTSNYIVYANLAAICGLQGKFDDFIDLLKKALELNPKHPDTHNNLGFAFQRQGDTDAAITSYKKALELNFSFPEAHYNLGTALHEQGDLTATIASFNNALELNPNFPDAHNNLGVALFEQGELTAAIASFDNALKLNPNFPDVHWNSSLAMLLGGDYRKGWEEYEWRFKKQKDTIRPNAFPKCRLWNGERPSQDDQLLLVSEQGLGDTLHFMRYALTLHSQGVALALCAPRKLHGLMQASGIDSSPLTPEQANQVTDGQWVPILSLPRILEVSPENPIITEPYIKTTYDLTAKWNGMLSAEQSPIIGISWQGNPKTEKMGLRGRSLPLEALGPIAFKTNASMLSLQKGFGSEQLEACSFKSHFVSCQDEVNEIWDFLETAAIIANCDLVITSDTSVAHLAGGMGKTTWVLLHKVPDWRWGLEGDTTFWYPSMRLFRQRERGNWVEVIERVVEELQTHFRDVLGT
jgi:tetratricopeptide (TPR) repeat protein